MKNTRIEWADHTFNPWTGCQKVSPACEHCYAESWAKRSGIVEWGPGKPRRRTRPDLWRGPLRWDRDAEARGIRPRVFTVSLGDWLDPEVPIDWLADFLALVGATPNLDWLLLTKRPHLFTSRIGRVACRDGLGAGLAARWIEGRAPSNVWVGTTVENQRYANERMPQLFKIPAVVQFLSCEPLLGPVDLFAGCFGDRAVARDSDEPVRFGINHAGLRFGVDWVIAGGESGQKPRPMNPDWVRSIRDQCRAARVPFLFKQWGGVDKKAAGRELDGCTWDQFPQPARLAAPTP